jgi:hypothetical protein
LNTKHTNRTDDLPLKDALNLIKRFKAKRPYHGKKHSVMQAEEESFHSRKFTPYLMRTALEVIIGFSVDVTETKKIKMKFSQTENL